MKPLVHLENVSYTFQTPLAETKALDRVSFSVEKGEFIAVVGPSGCGKSTLLNLIQGLYLPSSGTITFHHDTGEHSGCLTGYMLQQDQLLEWRTIYENVILGLEIQHKMTPQNLHAALELLKEYGLYDFKDQKPSSLSGGMRQRAALIRTLVLNPKLLLLDEPFSALDYQTRIRVSNDISSILRSRSSTAILVTHDLSEAISFGDRILIFTPRPGTVKQILCTDFSPSLTPLERRQEKEFKTYFNILWEELNTNAS
ncbi:MAG: ATP-binding cassette domain-containing protein [Eubacterium sp.]|jgi:ABC-type nitrate/sulfonate/bicarbonate transport system, ATPase component|nr:ATP-binding cassette domain-containing protein [Eubacterium sp.]